jgi:2-polyprenyl-3-methyl-5-hydroxy-6-metoxy-1,4-benzoquinol methylase
MSKDDVIFSEVSVDRVQEYWNKRPCNIRHSTGEIGTRQYFDEVEARKYFVEPHILPFAQFERWKGKRVLEIGCGIGTDTINFARSGASVTAVDLSEESLTLAQKRADVFGLKDICFYRANAEELSSTVPIELYDLVYSFGVIHHTPHPQRAVEQIRQYMDADSMLKIMVYNRLSWKAFWILIKYGKGAFWRLDKLIADNSEAQFGSPVTYTYTKESIKKLLPGFEITDMWVDHIFPYRITDYVQYRYRKVWYFRYLPQRLFRWMEKEWGWHLCVNAHLMG